MRKYAFPLRPRCECYRKPGSFMTFGPRSWVRCEQPATMTVRFKKVEGTVVTQKKVVCCAGCYQEFLRREPNMPHKVTKDSEVRACG